MRATAFALFAVLTGIGASDPARSGDSVTGEAHVRDAVTIAVAGARYRLSGLASSEGRTCGKATCDEAAGETIGPLLAGKSVTCAKERRLGHGFFLARCMVDGGADVATLVLEAGLALPEPGAPASYVEAADRAKDNGRGMWAR